MTNDEDPDSEKSFKARQRRTENGNLFQRDGLYHANRRVRAKIDKNDWVLAPDERDLLSALGTDRFSKDVNRADLRKRFGLSIKDELAPLKALPNYPYWERRDEWGEQAEPFSETRSFWERNLRFEFESPGEVLQAILLFLAFWHVMLLSIPYGKLTSVMQQAIAWPSFFLSLYAGDYFVEFIEEAGWPSLLTVPVYLYLCLPIIAACFHAMMYRDTLPEVNKKPRNFKREDKIKKLLSYAHKGFIALLLLILAKAAYNEFLR